MDLETREKIREHYDYLLNVLNEVLNGFSVDFEGVLKTPKQDVVSLFKKLDKGGHYELSSEEARLLLNCSMACLREFDASEFETRLGVTPVRAQQVNQVLASLT